MKTASRNEQIDRAVLNATEWTPIKTWAKELNCHPTTVSIRLKQLERQGLVQRRKNGVGFEYLPKSGNGATQETVAFADLPHLGATLRVTGLQEKEDGAIALVLRNGKASYLVSLDGQVS